jgi:hypothetical protein
MGTLLVDADEYTHTVGPASNWNESRYIDFWDARARVGGWFRIGNRPNEQHAEMSACINLPDGRAAFMFSRPQITGNALDAEGQQWHIDSPWDTTRVSYHGEMIVLNDPWQLVNPKRAFEASPRVQAAIDLTTHARGLESVMGFDQDHIDRIFLPGQADFHYQHLIRTHGRVRVGEQEFQVDGRGAKDHSWGPRNWHAKIYLRWLIASFDDDHGFILVRAVGPSKKTRSGYVWSGGQFHLVDDFQMHNEYAGGPHFELRQTRLEIHSGTRTWMATGLLRIVKSPTDWITSDGRRGEGMCEYHDRIVDGTPVGLDD